MKRSICRPIDTGRQVEARTVVLEGTTRLLKSTSKVKTRKSGPVVYERYVVHIPSKIANDSLFPFQAGEELFIEVDPRGRLLLRS